MCGRYTLDVPLDMLRAAFGFSERLSLQPRYNMAPVRTVPVVRRQIAAVRQALGL